MARARILNGCVALTKSMQCFANFGRIKRDGDDKNVPAHLS